MRRLALLLVALIVMTSCGSNDDSLPPARRTKVVATAYPVFEAVGTVGGRRVHASNLLPLDPFAALSAEKAEELRSAPLAIILGKGTQPDVERVAMTRTGPTVRILDYIEPKPAPPEMSPLVVDPYVWLSPQNMAKLIEQVRIALVSVDPEGAKKYQRNAKNFGHMVAAIDSNYARTIATCKRKDLVTADTRYQYLADRFGLLQRVVPAEDGQLRAAIDRYRPSTVFLHDLPPLDEARRITEAYEVRVAVLDPIAAQTDQARRGGATYGSMMALNLDALRAALGCATNKMLKK